MKVHTRACQLHDLITEARMPGKAKALLASLSADKRRAVAIDLVGGRTALCVALRHSYYELIEYLLKQCAVDVDQMSHYATSDGLRFRATALVGAACMNDVRAVQILLSQGAIVSKVDSGGCNALHAACETGCKDVVEAIVNNKINIESKTPTGATALMVACTAGNTNIARYLISQGADIHTIDNDGVTCLMMACKKNHTALAKYLIEQRAKVNAQNHRCETSLMWATAKNNIEIVRSLVEYGAEVNAADLGGWTSLIKAAKLNHTDIAKYLVEQGAGVNLCDHQRRSPLMFSIALAEDHTLSAFLIENGADVHHEPSQQGSILMWAIIYEQPEIVRLLLQKGVRSDITVFKHRLPLFLFSFSFSVKVVEILLEFGADVNTRDHHGNTALVFALKLSPYNKAVVEVLLKCHADPNMHDDDGNRPVHLALERNLGLRTLGILLAYNANINGSDAKGNTALHLAVKARKPNLVKYLLEHGADPGEMNYDKISPVHVATKKLDYAMMHILVPYTRNINAGYQNQRTLLHLAFWKICDTELANKLLDKGADANVIDSEGNTPLHYAVKWKLSKVVRLLSSHGADPKIENNASKSVFDILPGGQTGAKLRRAMNKKSRKQKAY